MSHALCLMVRVSMALSIYCIHALIALVMAVAVSVIVVLYVSDTMS